MKNIAKILLDIKAVTLSPDEPYTWASGIKSPIYCDNRLILSYPEERKEVESSLAEIVKNKFPQAQYIMGTATAGIPHAALIAEKLNLPMGYVRSSNKGHGKQNKIEGRKIENAKVVVIEDLFSTAGSSIDAAKALEEEGYEILGIISVFTYNLDSAKKNFEKENYQHDSLTNLDELVELAVETGYINAKQAEKLKKFQNNPNDSSWME